MEIFSHPSAKISYHPLIHFFPPLGINSSHPSIYRNFPIPLQKFIQPQGKENWSTHPGLFFTKHCLFVCEMPVVFFKNAGWGNAGWMQEKQKQKPLGGCENLRRGWMEIYGGGWNFAVEGFENKEGEKLKNGRGIENWREIMMVKSQFIQLDLNWNLNWISSIYIEISIEIQWRFWKEISIILWFHFLHFLIFNFFICGFSNSSFVDFHSLHLWFLLS